MLNLPAKHSDFLRRTRTGMITVGVLVASWVGSTLAEFTDGETSKTETAVGAIEGVVIYESDPLRPWRYRRYYVVDRKTGRLAEAVVSLAEDPPKLRPADVKPRMLTVDQKDYRFIPETLAIRSGDQVKFTNSDAILHDVTTRQSSALSSDAFKQSSFSLQQRQAVLQTYRDAGGTERPVTLSCSFHSAMRGWIYVFDHAFFQVTDEEGMFRIESVPAGKHRLVMLHSAGNLRWTQMVDVKPGETQRIEIRVSPDNVLATQE